MSQTCCCKSGEFASVRGASISSGLHQEQGFPGSSTTYLQGPYLGEVLLQGCFGGVPGQAQDHQLARVCISIPCGDILERGHHLASPIVLHHHAVHQRASYGCLTGSENECMWMAPYTSIQDGARHKIRGWMARGGYVPELPSFFSICLFLDVVIRK